MANTPVFPDPLGHAGMVMNANTDVREVEPLDVETHEQGRALPVVGAAHAMAKGTASVKPAEGGMS